MEQKEVLGGHSGMGLRGGRKLGNLSLCLHVSLIHSILQRKRLESNIYFWETKGSLLDYSMPIK